MLERSDETDAHPREQEITAGFFHEFINPDVFAKILARLICLGTVKVRG